MKLFYIIPVALILQAHSCSNDAKLREGILEIGFRECVGGRIDGKKLKLCFDSLVEDSRCPANAICIWQGAAVARLSFTKKRETVSFSLSTLQMPPRYVKDTVVMGYKFEFVNLSPYPGTVPSPIPDETRKAELRITKQ